MEDDETTQEPGWRPTTEPEPEKLTTTSTEAARSRNPFASRASAKASSSQSQSSNPTSSSPVSDSDSTAAPVPFADLVAEGLKLAAIGATFITRKTFGYELTMNDTEARRLAKPIARVIARRYRITKDFADATDVVGAGGGMMTWLNRVVASHEQKAQTPSAQTVRYETAPPARSPVPESALLSEDANWREFAAAQRQPDVSGDREGNPVVGSGPAKGVFLAGFEDV